jgi:hypothetical protein
MSDRDEQHLLGQIRACEILVPHRTALAPSVSQWSVGMHIHHCALVMQGIAAAAARCDAAAPRWSPNFLRAVVLATGRIPRGRVEAPAATRPAAEVGDAQLAAALHDAAESVRRLSAVPADAWFRHFALGVLRGRSVARFLAVHNRHHLRIISDILAA